MAEQKILEELKALREEVASLKKRVESLEPQVAANTEIDPETLEVIAAAVAAYLGKRATIRIVRKVADRSKVDGWRVQGRVNIQGSHARR